VLIGHRVITPEDEEALLPDEEAQFRSSAPKVRRRSGAARSVARSLLKSLGLPETAILRSASGAPIWPHGIVGSLAHDEDIAIAAVAASHQFSALGIDVEPATRLPPEIIEMVTTPRERERYATEVIESRLLFAVKESIYKALNPLDGRFLDFQDIEVDIPAKLGRTRNGAIVDVVFTTHPRVVAISFR
jgi:4'-phosphopantetheinyl transferase EntD